MNPLRQIHERPDGRRVVTFRCRDFTALALDLLAPGTTVWCAPHGPHAVAAYVERHTLRRAPLCVATPAPKLHAQDPDQLSLAA